MKYTITTILSLFIIVNSFSQSLVFDKISDDSVEADYFTEMSTYVTVENVSANTNIYRVERQELSMVPGHSSYFCWSIDCYPPNVSIATSTVTLGPNEKDSTFTGYLTPYDSLGPYDGTSVVKYVFYNDGDLSDSISAVFVYTATPASGEVQARVLNSNDFYAFPNPTVNELKVAYGDITGVQKGRLIIRNILGSELIVQNIDLKNNIAHIDVSRLNKGVYFYSVELDGKNVHTKKFAVSK